MSYHRGFSLPSLLLWLTLGSVIALASLGAVSQLISQVQQQYQRYYLTYTLQQHLHTIATLLKRAGFIYRATGLHASQARLPLPAPLVVGHYPGEPAASCLLLYYDRNRNGFMSGRSPTGLATTLGYRLRQGNLETQQGVITCHSSRWEDLMDERIITVQRFQIVHPPGASWVELSLQGCLTRRPAIIQRLHAVIQLENRP
jgi:prepilin peptidase dependent protein B